MIQYSEGRYNPSPTPRPRPTAADCVPVARAGY